MIWPSYFDGATGREIVRLGGAEAQACGAYLMCAYEANMLGLYRLPLAILQVRLGSLKPKRLERALCALGSAGFADYDRITEHVWVRQMAFYRLGLEEGGLERADNRVKHARRLYEDAEPNPFLGAFYHRYRADLHLTKERTYTGPAAVLRLPDDALVASPSADHKMSPLTRPLEGPSKPVTESVSGSGSDPEDQDLGGARSERAPTRALLTQFDDLHQKALGVSAVISGAKDAKLVATLARKYGAEMVGDLMREFFLSTDPFIQQAGYTVGVFHSQVGKLLARRNQHRLPVAVQPGKPRTAAETTLHTLRKLEADDALHG